MLTHVDHRQRLLRAAIDESLGDTVGSDRLIQMTLDALMAGIDTPALRQLAGLSRSEEPDAHDLLAQVIHELGLAPAPSAHPPPTPRETYRQRIVAEAGRLLDGPWPPTDETNEPGTDPVAVAGWFNGCVNRRDINGLAGLMSDDHRFVDSEGNAVSGKQACLDAWRGFFESFPDYRNVFTSLTAKDGVVTIVGYSECAEPSLAGPALWTAAIQGEVVTEWRVYPDTPAIRASLGCGH